MKSELFPMAIRAFPVGPTQRLQVAVAAESFWLLKKDFLLRLGDYLHVGFHCTDSLVSILETLVCHILEQPPSAVIDILALRLGAMHPSISGIEQFLDMPDATSCISRREMEDLQHELGSEGTKAQALKEFKSSWVQRRGQVKSPGQKPKRPCSRAGKKTTQLGVRALPEGDLYQKDLKPLLPPNAFLWRGHQKGTWNGHLFPFPRIARSWQLYGHRTAAVLVLRQLWEQHLTLEGLEVSECPVLGLFGDEAETAALPEGPGGASSSSAMPSGSS